ncbi:DDE-type integrase/transposase/recombinase [Hymenobacter actinosclerus]|uniref:DDE-type integrase/transposase/recombinase n=1 Tax=Hymenobacter actinosclerus TaxID=82805 RepID=UPI000B867681
MSQVITHSPRAGGRWCYLATWCNTYSRRVVGWHLAAQMPPTELVLFTLEQALPLRHPRRAMHADRGCQHTSAACRARIAADAVVSFRRPANPYDNAQAEADGTRSKPNYCLATAHSLSGRGPTGSGSLPGHLRQP